MLKLARILLLILLSGACLSTRSYASEWIEVYPETYDQVWRTLDKYNCDYLENSARIFDLEKQVFLNDEEVATLFPQLSEHFISEQCDINISASVLFDALGYQGVVPEVGQVLIYFDLAVGSDGVSLLHHLPFSEDFKRNYHERVAALAAITTLKKYRVIPPVNRTKPEE